MGAQASGLTIHPGVFIYARQSSLLHLAGLIDTPSAKLFLDGNIAAPKLSDWQCLKTEVSDRRNPIGGLHFLSLGALEANASLLASVWAKRASA